MVCSAPRITLRSAETFPPLEAAWPFPASTTVAAPAETLESPASRMDFFIAISWQKDKSKNLAGKIYRFLMVPIEAGGGICFYPSKLNQPVSQDGAARPVRDSAYSGPEEPRDTQPNSKQTLDTIVVFPRL